GETTIWQLRKRPRRRPRKRAERNPPRRDSSFTQGTTTSTFKWRTSSKAARPTLKERRMLIGAPFLLFWALLLTLREKHLSIILLHKVAELSFEEIAENLTHARE